ncbi:MAG: hypothetical protein KA228_10965, partial [Flavobacterium sp.]|nr:hypothetical protein [Flavobacterium sp.]
ILMYTTIENCEVENFVEKGKWWVKDGVFYEKYEDSDEPDVYTVEMLDDKNVKFKAKKLSPEFDNKEYEFTETRQE